LRRLAAAGIAVVAGLFAWAALDRYLAPVSNTARDHFDAIIVLGNPADSDGNPGPTQLARVTEAVREYERGVAPRLIVTGAAVRNRFVEARVMARTAEAQGVPAGSVFIEPNARDTVQNACYAVRIMRQHGWTSAEIISSPYHLARAGIIFSRLPIEWRTHPAPSLEPPSQAATAFNAALEDLKMIHYQLWSRWREPCGF
jgi:uncharacterized SAM-binding protein YcdF (DUF218 family)